MDNPLFKSRWTAILWKELPEVMRLFDNPKTLRFPDPGNSGSDVDVEMPGDLHAYLGGFGHLLDRFEVTLSQFYADGFVAQSPTDDDARQIQPWLVPYFADLFGVTLYAPDPESRRSELAQAIWVARRRGTRIAVDRAAEAILQRGVIAVQGLDRVLFTPSFKTPRLTQTEITGKAHAKDPIILHDAMSGGETLSSLRTRHSGFPLGARDTRRHMRAHQSTGFRLDSDSKPALDPTGKRIAVRFTIADRAGVPCFLYSYEDRALRTPDIRARLKGLQSETLVSRPDAVYLYVDPPPGVFDENIEVVAASPVFADGRLSGPATTDPDKMALYRPAAPGTVTATIANGKDGNGWHQIEGLRLDGTLRIAAGTDVTLIDFAVRHIVVVGDGKLTLRNGICETVTGATPGATSEVEYVTVTGAARFRQLNASDSIFADLFLSPGGAPGCLRYSRFAGGPLPAHVSLRNSTEGPVHYLRWPCLPDPADVTKTLTRTALFGEPGYGVLAPDNPYAVTNRAEDGGEIGCYHRRFHLARLRAAECRAQEFTPAGHRVFARYDLRSAAPLPTVVAGS